MTSAPDLPAGASGRVVLTAGARRGLVLLSLLGALLLAASVALALVWAGEKRSRDHLSQARSDAVAAARQFLFEPAEVNGKRIPVKITYRYDFVVKQEVIKRTNSDFEGTVRDRGTKKPIPGVKIKLETGQEATTDAQGHFLIPAVESGDHTVTLSGEGLTQVGTKETFEGGKKLDATYDVELKASVRRLRHRRCRPCSRQRRRLRRSRRPSRTSSTLPPSGARSRRRQANVAERRSPVPRCLGD